MTHPKDDLKKKNIDLEKEDRFRNHKQIKQHWQKKKSLIIPQHERKLTGTIQYAKKKPKKNKKKPRQ